jgi:hypothetical protein
MGKSRKVTAAAALLLASGCAADAVATADAPARWYADEVRVCVHEDVLVAPAQAAAEAWAGLGPALVIDCEWPDVRVFFADTGAELAITDALAFDRQLRHADVLVSSAAFEDVAEPVHDAQAVLTHEFGHVLGLDEIHEPSATMWPDIAVGDVGARDLAPMDIEAALALYP